MLEKFFLMLIQFFLMPIKLFLTPIPITSLKQRINYSASKASEDGMWGPSATPKDVCISIISVNMLQGPVGQNFRNADV